MKQEGLLWYDNRENSAGFPSEYDGFEFRGKKKSHENKRGKRSTLIKLKQSDSGSQTCSKIEVTLNRGL